MTEPDWVALGPGNAVIDFVGGWSASVNYLPGNVVRHNGIDYLAVNPSIGQAPPAASSPSASIGTSLPASPTDGQEFILVDSLTAPTYAWRFRYVAGIGDTYKWIFVGGTPSFKERDATGQGIAAGQLAAIGATGWIYDTQTAFTIPQAGIYIVEASIAIAHAGDGNVAAISIFSGTTVNVGSSNRYGMWYGNVSWDPSAHTMARITAAAATVVGGAVQNPASKRLRGNSVRVQPVRVS